MNNYLIVLILTLFMLIMPGGFEESTLIKIPSGYRPCAQLTIVDQLISYDTNENKEVVGYLLYAFPYQVKQGVELTFRLQEVQCTLLCDTQQLFKSSHAWLKAQELQQGDYVATLSGQAVVIKKEYIHHDLTLCCLSVNPPFNYCVTPLDIIVHNELITISLTYLIGQGFVWPTFAGFFSAAACCALKFVANRIDYDMRSSNPKPNHNQQERRPDQEPTPPEPDDENSNMSSDQQPEEDHSGKEIAKAGAGTAAGALSNKKVRDTLWGGAHYAKNKAQKAVAYTINKAKEVAKHISEPHPHGIYNSKTYHRAQDSGRKTRAPKNPQYLLDTSVEVINENRILKHRVAWEDDKTIAVFKVERPKEFHGHIETWKTAGKNIRDTLRANGLATSTGKRIINE